MTLNVDVIEPPSGATLFRLEIRHGDQVIGEYERSREQNVTRKKAEIASAENYLLELYRLHGRFTVRWDGVSRTKVVKDEVGNKIGEIPGEYWH